MRCPDRETLRAMVRNNEVWGGYLLIAASLFQLVEDGAHFSLTDTRIVIMSDGCVPYCTLELPDLEWQANYFIDIITPNILCRSQTQ